MPLYRYIASCGIIAWTGVDGLGPSLNWPRPAWTGLHWPAWRPCRWRTLKILISTYTGNYGGCLKRRPMWSWSVILSGMHHQLKVLSELCALGSWFTVIYVDPCQQKVLANKGTYAYVGSYSSWWFKIHHGSGNTPEARCSHGIEGDDTMQFERLTASHVAGLGTDFGGQFKSDEFRS